MARVLKDIQTGEYAKSFILETRVGAPVLESRVLYYSISSCFGSLLKQRVFVVFRRQFLPAPARSTPFILSLTGLRDEIDL